MYVCVCVCLGAKDEAKGGNRRDRGVARWCESGRGRWESRVRLFSAQRKCTLDTAGAGRAGEKESGGVCEALSSDPRNGKIDYRSRASGKVAGQGVADTSRTYSGSIYAKNPTLAGSRVEFRPKLEDRVSGVLTCLIVEALRRIPLGRPANSSGFLASAHRREGEKNANDLGDLLANGIISFGPLGRKNEFTSLSRSRK